METETIRCPKCERTIRVEYGCAPQCSCGWEYVEPDYIIECWECGTSIKVFDGIGGECERCGTLLHWTDFQAGRESRDAEVRRWKADCVKLLVHAETTDLDPAFVVEMRRKLGLEGA